MEDAGWRSRMEKQGGGKGGRSSRKKQDGEAGGGVGRRIRREKKERKTGGKSRIWRSRTVKKDREA